MKLYYMPASCSLSPHIVINELGLDVELIKVDHASHKTETGLDFHDINPQQVQRLLGDNAIEVYGLDRTSLSDVAARIGPTVESIAQTPGPLPTQPDGLAFRTRGKYS